MGTRTFADVAPTAATIALNAYIYGYGGHSLVTPHAALKQLWWTDDQIEAKVTRQFVISKLRGEERGFLDRQLAFGEGLTDDTYMEWILEKAKRLFLILTEIGIPDQIFGIIDDSWDDNDLPIVLDDIPALELAAEDDPQLNKRFYDKQFLYLLRELKRGSHVDYGPNGKTSGVLLSRLLFLTIRHRAHTDGVRSQAASGCGSSSVGQDPLSQEAGRSIHAPQVCFEQQGNEECLQAELFARY